MELTHLRYNESIENLTPADAEGAGHVPSAAQQWRQRRGVAKVIVGGLSCTAHGSARDVAQRRDIGDLREGQHLPTGIEFRYRRQQSLKAPAGVGTIEIGLHSKLHLL